MAKTQFVPSRIDRDPPEMTWGLLVPLQLPDPPQKIFWFRWLREWWWSRRDATTQRG